MYYVYVVLLGTKHFEKIKPGISKNPKERIRSYRTTHAIVETKLLEDGFESQMQAEARAKSIEYMLREYKLGKPKNEIFEYNDKSAQIIDNLINRNKGINNMDKYTLAKNVSNTFNIPLKDFYDFAENYEGTAISSPSNTITKSSTIEQNSSIAPTTADINKLIDKALKGIPKGQSFTNEDIYKAVGVNGSRKEENSNSENNKIRRSQELVRHILQKDFKSRFNKAPGEGGRCRRYLKK